MGTVSTHNILESINIMGLSEVEVTGHLPLTVHVAGGRGHILVAGWVGVMDWRVGVARVWGA